ncbi:MAG: chromate transporter [Clostridiales bacterium]|nr:chromate transporter [Clostridiales bacterium]MCD7880854.1 chromate transporter [Clostridiales bacterium]MCD8384343.1 chromate transporter [Clostridiales bacterium]
MNVYLDLFLTFARVGVCTFGGGYAMLPILQREVVEKKGWATDAELTDYYAIGQCTPGVIAVNTATFIGHKYKGILGGIVATLGMVFPSLVIISVIAAFLQNFADNVYVIHAFNGIRACVCVLIFNAVMKLRKSTVIDMPTAVIFLVVFLLSAIWGISPAILVLVCGVIGLALKLMQERRGQKGGDEA